MLATKSITELTQPFIKECSDIVTDVRSNELFKTTALDNMLNKINDIIISIGPVQDDLNEHCNTIDALMHSESLGYYNNDSTINNIINNSTPLDYSNRQLEISANCKKELLSRIALYVSWKLPAAQLFPANGELTEYLVSCDPLYLLDIDSRHLKEVKQLFTGQYQDRLRYYTIGTDIETNMLKDLPQEQLGFVLAWGFFNYRSLPVTRAYLSEIFNLLRAGGTVLLSYNNCENPKAVEQVENGYASFILKTDLLKEVKLLGYEVLSTVDKDSNISWIEIKKPGELVSNRAGQALASIIHSKG